MRSIFMMWLLGAAFIPPALGQAPSLKSERENSSWFDEKMKSLQVRKGYFGFQIVDHVQQDHLVNRQIPQRLKIEDIEQSLKQQSKRLSCVNLSSSSLSNAYNINWPNLPSDITQLSALDIQDFILTDAIQVHLHDQIQTWQQAYALHIDLLHSLHTLVDTKLESFVDVEALAQQIIVFAQTYPWDQLDTSDLSSFSLNDIPWESFYNQEALAELLSSLDSSLDSLHQQSQWAIQALGQTTKEVLATTWVQGQLALAQQGYTFDNGTIFFKDPYQNKDSFTFNSGIDQSTFNSSGQSQASHMTGAFDASLSDFIALQGSITVQTQNLVNQVQVEAQSTINSLLSLFEQSIANPTTIGSFLGELESFFQNVSKEQKDQLLGLLNDHIASDFSLSLDLQNLSDRFEGKGTYEYIDVILETLGHDIGIIDLSKQQILDLVSMLTDGTKESSISKFVLNDLLHINTDVVSYRVTQEAVNGYLAHHFQGNILALQLSMTSSGGILYQNQAVFGAATIRHGRKANWTVTGSYNQRFDHQSSPLIKSDGYLRAQAHLLSHSVGIAYIPKLWQSNCATTKLNGIVQLEALFIQPQTVKIVTQTQQNLETANSNVYELYNVSLNELDEVKDVYTIPMLSAGINLQHQVTPSLTISGYAIAYPGMKKKGSLDKIPDAITAKFQSGFSIIMHMQAQ